MATEFYFSALGDSSLGLIAAGLLLQAYERDLKEKNCLSDEMIGSETFCNLVFREYLTLCFHKGYVTPESLPRPLEKWSQENFDKYPALRIEGINILFNRYCSKTEIFPKLKKEEGARTPLPSHIDCEVKPPPQAPSNFPPSYTTKTFAKLDPGTSLHSQISPSHDLSRGLRQQPVTAVVVDSKLGFHEAMLEHLGKKRRG
jgi:hypothetical protein